MSDFNSSTGMTDIVVKDNIEFIEEEIEEIAWRKIEIPIDKEGAEFLFFNNAGELLSWPENVEAYRQLLDQIA